MRVAGTEPVFRPLDRADVRPTLSGVVDRVFVHEGAARRARRARSLTCATTRFALERDAALAAVAAAERRRRSARRAVTPPKSVFSVYAPMFSAATSSCSTNRFARA